MLWIPSLNLQLSDEIELNFHHYLFINLIFHTVNYFEEFNWLQSAKVGSTSIPFIIILRHYLSLTTFPRKQLPMFSIIDGRSHIIVLRSFDEIIVRFNFGMRWCWRRVGVRICIIGWSLFFFAETLMQVLWRSATFVLLRIQSQVFIFVKLSTLPLFYFQRRTFWLLLGFPLFTCPLVDIASSTSSSLRLTASMSSRDRRWIGLHITVTVTPGVSIFGTMVP